MSKQHRPAETAPQRAAPEAAAPQCEQEPLGNAFAAECLPGPMDDQSLLEMCELFATDEFGQPAQSEAYGEDECLPDEESGSAQLVDLLQMDTQVQQIRASLAEQAWRGLAEVRFGTMLLSQTGKVVVELGQAEAAFKDVVAAVSTVDGFAKFLLRSHSGMKSEGRGDLLDTLEGVALLFRTLVTGTRLLTRGIEVLRAGSAAAGVAQEAVSAAGALSLEAGSWKLFEGTLGAVTSVLAMLQEARSVWESENGVEALGHGMKMVGYGVSAASSAQRVGAAGSALTEGTALASGVGQGLGIAGLNLTLYGIAVLKAEEVYGLAGDLAAARKVFEVFGPLIEAVNDLGVLFNEAAALARECEEVAFRLVVKDMDRGLKEIAAMAVDLTGLAAAEGLQIERVARHDAGAESTVRAAVETHHVVAHLRSTWESWVVEVPVTMGERLGFR